MSTRFAVNLPPVDKWYLWRERRTDGDYEWILQWPRGQRYWDNVWGPIRTAYDTFEEARQRIVEADDCINVDIDFLWSIPTTGSMSSPLRG